MAKSDRIKRRAERRKNRITKKKNRVKTRAQRKEDKAAVKKEGGSILLLRPFRASMRNALQRRFPSRNIKQEYKNNFPGLILEFYKKVLYPNRGKIRPESSDGFEDTRYNIPTPENATAAIIAITHQSKDSDMFIEGAVKVVSSIVRAIISFFKSLKRDKEEGVPLGDLGDVANEAVKVERELQKQVNREVRKTFIEPQIEKALPYLGAALFLL